MRTQRPFSSASRFASRCKAAVASDYSMDEEQKAACKALKVTLFNNMATVSEGASERTRQGTGTERQRRKGDSETARQRDRQRQTAKERQAATNSDRATDRDRDGDGDGDGDRHRQAGRQAGR